MLRTKSKRTNDHASSDNEQAEILRILSQSVFDILEIIKAYFLPPITIDKELHRLYRGRLNILKNTLTLLPAEYEIPLPDPMPDSKLFFNPGRTERQKERIHEGEEIFSTLLGTIQEKRVEIPDYIATTGIEDEGLKEYIKNVYKEKGVKYRSSYEDKDNNGAVTFKDGNYYYLGELMDFRGKGALYFKIFEIIFNHQKDGFIPYDDIIAHFDEERIPRSRGRKENIKRIQSAVTGSNAGFNRSVMVGRTPFSELKRSTSLMKSDNKEKGIRFNNQK